MRIERFLIGKIVGRERRKYQKDLEKQQRENRMPEGVTEKAFPDFHLYLPEKSHTAARVVVNVHGGGMIMGNRIFNRYFNARMSSKGFAVIAAEYPLTPENELTGMLEGLAGSIREGLKQMEQEGFRTEEIYLTADSAGAFLSLYLYACAENKELRRRMGIDASVFVGFPLIRGMGLCSGMFYSRLKDSIGRFVGPQIWGKHPDERFGAWMDLEYVLTQTAFPPLYLFTSEGDFLKAYTCRFYEACRRNGQNAELKVFEDPGLVHAFQVFQPGAEETAQTVDLLERWFV